MTTLHATRGANFWSRASGHAHGSRRRRVRGHLVGRRSRLHGSTRRRDAGSDRASLQHRRARRLHHAPARRDVRAAHHRARRARAADDDRPRRRLRPHARRRHRRRVHVWCSSTCTKQSGCAPPRSRSRPFSRPSPERSPASIMRSPSLKATGLQADVPLLQQHVLCGITGGSDRAATRDEIVRRGFGNDELIVDVSPAFLLQAGLPYSRSDIAIVLGYELTDVPERYREEERAQRLVSSSPTRSTAAASSSCRRRSGKSRKGCATQDAASRSLRRTRTSPGATGGVGARRCTRHQRQHHDRLARQECRSGSCRGMTCRSPRRLRVRLRPSRSTSFSRSPRRCQPGVRELHSLPLELLPQIGHRSAPSIRIRRSAGGNPDNPRRHARAHRRRLQAHRRRTRRIRQTRCRG